MDVVEGNEIHYPAGYRMVDILAWGSFGMILHKPDSHIVIKSAHDEESQIYIDVEKLIYERSEDRHGHEGVLKYYGPYESAIQLEYAAHGDLRSFLAKSASPIEAVQYQRWALQIARALVFIHELGVVHGDLSSANIFLGSDESARIGDFSGSSLDGSRLLVHAQSSYAHPTLAGSQRGDIFAYGSLIYEIITGSPPLGDLDSQEIHNRFARDEFPETMHLGSLESIVRKCWLGQYSNASELVCHLQNVLSSPETQPKSSEKFFSPSAIAIGGLVIAGACVVVASTRFFSKAKLGSWIDLQMSR